MQIQDAPFDTLLVMEERMEDEIRRMYYVRRREGVSPFSGDSVPKNFIPTYGIATVQGTPW